MQTGRCLCGAVSFAIDGPLFGIWFCHCSKCRRAAGGAFQAGAVCEATRFRWLSGEQHVAHHRTASGYRRAFCSVCGSPAPLRVADTPYVWLPAGALEGDPGIRPIRHIHVASKAPWYEITDALPQFAEDVAKGT